MTKLELSEEIGDCHIRATYDLERLGRKDITNVTDYCIDEVIRELEKMRTFVKQYNSIKR